MKLAVECCQPGTAQQQQHALVACLANVLLRMHEWVLATCTHPLEWVETLQRATADDSLANCRLVVYQYFTCECELLGKMQPEGGEWRSRARKLQEKLKVMNHDV
jgi:hypothetical protein